MRSGRRLRVAVLSGLVAGLLVTLAGPAEAASSWKSVRTEEFSGSSLPSGCGAYEGKYPSGASVWKDDDVVLKGGLLRLKLRERKASGRKYTSGGVGCWGWAQKYGRYEVRAKVPQGKGIDSYLTLVPSKQGDGAWSGVELLAPGTETAFITNGFGSKAGSSQTAQVEGEYSDKFHTYVIEWAPKHFRVTVDGDEIFYSTDSYTGKRWPGLVVSNGDKLTGVPDATTDLPAEFQIDRIKVSSYTGVAPKPGRSTPASTAPKPGASGSGVPAPITPVPVGNLEADPAEGPALAGGIWPWLLGGSVIAGSAALLLGYPARREAHRAKVRSRQNGPTPRHQPRNQPAPRNQPQRREQPGSQPGNRPRNGPPDRYVNR